VPLRVRTGRLCSGHEVRFGSEADVPADGTARLLDYQ
jgi:hypothetical protein